MNHESKFFIPDSCSDDDGNIIIVSEEAKDLLRKLVCSNENRLGKNGIDDFKSHPFFGGIDWETIGQSVPPYIPEVTSPYDTSNFDTEDDVKLKEAMPTNSGKNAGFRGYHLPFVGFTYTENCLLNDRHSLMDFLGLANQEGANEELESYRQMVSKLKKELESSNGNEKSEDADLKSEIEENRVLIEELNVKLNEMSSAYEVSLNKLF